MVKQGAVYSAPKLEYKQKAWCCLQCTVHPILSTNKRQGAVYSAPKLEYKQKAGCCTEFTG